MILNIKYTNDKLGKEIPAPDYATEGAAAADLAACIDAPITINSGASAIIPTGIAIALNSKLYVALVFARSSLGFKHGVTLANSVGVIDSDYRGEIKVCLQNHSDKAYTIQPGDRIAQLVISPILRPTFQVVDELSTTERGEGGFGSTGV